MLTNFFLQILQRSLTAGIVICVVLLVRGTIFLKFPKKYAYLLWIVVGIRLVCPFEIPSPISGLTLPWSEEFARFDLQQTAEATEEGANERDMVNQAGISDEENTVSNIIEPSDEILSEEGGILRKEETRRNMLQLLTVVWLVGSCLIIAYNFILYLRMKRHLQRGVRYRENIYECEGIAGPFVIGLRKPVIYIPFWLREEEREYILQHELFHIKRHDNFIKFFAFLLVAVYWFQPMVWVAWICMVCDMEMSCDEHVLAKADKDVKKQYSLSLLAFATNERKYSVERLHFGEKNVKRRIRYIMNMKDSKKWLGGLAIAFIIIVGAVCLTSFSNTKEQFLKGNGQMANTVDMSGNDMEDGGEKEADLVPEEGKAGENVNKSAEVGETKPDSMNTGMIEKRGDVTGDGIADTIRINSSAADTAFADGSPVITVISGKSEEVIYTLDNNEINAAVHPGYNSYYLYHGETQDYLLMWNPQMYQGIASYKWSIFSLDEKGKKQVLEKDELSFDGNRPKKSDIPDLKQFEANLNKRLKKAELLIDTIDGELKTDVSDKAYLYDASDTVKELEG